MFGDKELDILKTDFEGIVSKKNFGNDLVVGEVGENLFKQYLIKYKGLSFVRKSEDKKDLKKWDLEFLFKDEVVRYEIKTDVYVKPDRDTGNMFVEFYSRGIDSGIASTEADVWVNIYFHLKEIWIIMVPDLKRLIEENSFRQTEYSGDLNSNTRGYLIPRERVKNNFKIIKYKTNLI
jgi:hypothetical protein